MESINQEVKENFFNKTKDVPKKAISMSINQIMKSKNIICIATEKRKADAVKNCFGDKIISPEYPTSILKKHKKAFVYLDKNSSSN